MSLTVDPARPADLEALSALHTASWRAAYGPLLGQGPLGAPLTEHMARTWASLPEGVIVARDGDTLAGFLRLKRNQGWPYIDNLHVDPERRGGGIGRWLMAAAVALIPEDEARVWLTVLADNHPARAFYRGLGGTEGARIDEVLLGVPVVTFPVIWTRLAPLAAACK
ncbi:GNAT family N-acetyltransferase [Oceaniglobus roseus]|uniref:GNAT family N-acetyltransferase n=1 Tax=Oceaniglobus roseus TaxID=1737570 RepID=UPI000C7F3BB1|nr:GNAT family N-acetyltransferase [Kandeliimicrobium roseum]